MDPSNQAAADNTDDIQTVTLTRILKALKEGAIDEEHGLLGWSSNYTSLLTVTEADLELLAVYKPRRGERPLWDFPTGTLCNREVAAFLVSAALTWDIVPPTVLREGPRGPGSMQLYIYHDPDEHFFNFAESEDLVRRMKQFAAFDVIVNNADRKGGHFIRDAQGHIWGIDQGLTFNVAHKLRTVLWDFAGAPVPVAILDNIEQKLLPALCPGERLHNALSTLLDPREIDATQKRAERLLRKKNYPQPGSGPNYPWPAI